MSNRKAERNDREAVAGLARELAALDSMTVGELAAAYRREFGVPTRTRNRLYLKKRLAYRIQERHEGRGLSQRALERIEQLAPEAQARWREPVAAPKAEAHAAATRARDSRLPAAGTVLRRVFDGREYEVKILDEGFEYDGKRYHSLSKIAGAITGTSWNGYLFFFGRARTGDRANEEVGA